MLETIREYAAESLEDAEPIARRHAYLYAGLVVKLGRALRNHEPEASAVLDTEMDNARAGLTLALSSGNAQLAGQFIFGLWFSWLVRGFGREAEHAATAWLGLDRSELDPETLAMALFGVSEIVRHTDRRPRDGAVALSVSLKLELLRLLAANPETTIVGWPSDGLAAAVHADLAMLSVERGDLAAAAGHVDEALDIRRRLGAQPCGVTHSLARLRRSRQSASARIPPGERSLR